MNEALPKCGRLRAVGLAVVTILSMFLTPLCGTLCSASRHCSTQVAVAESEAGDCHHLAISGDADDTRAAFTTAKNCSRPELSAVTLEATKIPSTLREARISILPSSAFAATQHYVFSLALSYAPWLKAGEGPRPTDPLTSTAILQI
jgi:hypothetical protein